MLCANVLANSGGMFLCIGVAQHRHRDNLLARATPRRMRSVAIEFGTCRWDRSGGASGSVTVGNRKFLGRPGGTRSTGGNRLPLGDQESVGGDAQRGVVVEAAQSSALEMPKPNLLLEFLIVALDAPAQLGEVDQRAERDILGKGREPVFGRLFLAFGPLDQQPFLRSALGELVVMMRGTNAHAGKARGQLLDRAFAPRDRAP